jgi:hypothetical protein
VGSSVTGLALIIVDAGFGRAESAERRRQHEQEWPRGHEHVVEALPRDRFESAIDEPAAGDEFSFWAESHAYDPNRR